LCCYKYNSVAESKCAIELLNVVGEDNERCIFKMVLKYPVDLGELLMIRSAKVQVVKVFSVRRLSQ
jgi:hypothetical protein